MNYTKLGHQKQYFLLFALCPCLEDVANSCLINHRNTSCCTQESGPHLHFVSSWIVSKGKVLHFSFTYVASAVCSSEQSTSNVLFFFPLSPEKHVTLSDFSCQGGRGSEWEGWACYVSSSLASLSHSITLPFSLLLGPGTNRKLEASHLLQLHIKERSNEAQNSEMDDLTFWSVLRLSTLWWLLCIIMMTLRAIMYLYVIYMS